MMDVWHLPEKDIERLKESRVVLSMSGGKDSTACALLLERHGIEFDRVFMDTGWDHPATYKYIKEELEPRFGKVEFLKSHRFENGMVDAIRHYGYFPDRNYRYCTGDLKYWVINKFFKSLDEDAVNVIGIRREESRSRSNALSWDYDETLNVDVFRPIVNHSFDDVIKMHHEGGIAPNPLYLQGFNRVGCFPCIFAKKDEVLKVSNLWKERIGQIADLEKELTERRFKKYQEDEEFRDKIKKRAIQNIVHRDTLKDLGITLRLLIDFERGKASIDDDVCAIYRSECLRIEKLGEGYEDFKNEKAKLLNQSFFKSRAEANPSIHDVVEWSKTSRGGRQMQMFDLTAKDGCMRWGMCESPIADEDLVKIQEPKE